MGFRSLESNPVPTTSFLIVAPLEVKKDVGTGLDSRLCLFPSLLLMCHPYIPLHFIEMLFILVPPIFSTKYACTDAVRMRISVTAVIYKHAI